MLGAVRTILTACILPSSFTADVRPIPKNNHNAMAHRDAGRAREQKWEAVHDDENHDLNVE